MEEELVAQRLDLQEAIDTCNILKCFLDNTPILCGVVELLDNDTDQM